MILKLVIFLDGLEQTALLQFNQLYDLEENLLNLMLLVNTVI